VSPTAPSLGAQGGHGVPDKPNANYSLTYMRSELLATTLRPLPARQAPCMPLHERVCADPPTPGVCARTINGINLPCWRFCRRRCARQLARVHARFPKWGSVTHRLLSHCCKAMEWCTCYNLRDSLLLSRERSSLAL